MPLVTTLSLRVSAFLLNDIPTNVGVATKENVNNLVASCNDLLLNGAKQINMLKTKYANINATKTSKYKD